MKYGPCWAVCIIAAVVQGCPRTQPGDSVPLTADEASPGVASVSRWLFLGGQRVARTEETWIPSKRELIRVSQLDGSSNDRSTIHASLDSDGFVRSASYQRRGPRGDRHLEFKDGLLMAGGRDRALGSQPVVLLESLCQVVTTSTTPIEIVDLATGESLPGAFVFSNQRKTVEDRFGGVIATCEADGRRIGPGAFVEVNEGGSVPSSAHAEVAPGAPGSPTDGLRLMLGGRGIPTGALALVGPGQRIAGTDPIAPETAFVSLRRAVVFDKTAMDAGAPRPQDYAPGLFIQSDDARVITFAARYAHDSAKASAKVTADALALAEAIGGLLDTKGGGGPPSAVGALTRKAGDCDDATALLVAALRALGHAARPVVGYRAANGRWVPHAWAEVYDASRWMPVDAMVPGIGPLVRI